MISCPSCGAANEEERVVCRTCGRALVAEAEEPSDRPLAPLPDGGLAAAMPDWLRRPAPATTPATDEAPDDLAPAPSGPPPDRTTPPPPVASVEPAPTDPTGFITEDDLPLWIRQLVAREETGEPPPRAAPEPVAAASGVALTTPEPAAAQIGAPGARREPVPAAPPTVETGPPSPPNPARDQEWTSRPLLPILVVLALVALTALVYLYTRGMI